MPVAARWGNARWTLRNAKVKRHRGAAIDDVRRLCTASSAASARRVGTFLFCPVRAACRGFDTLRAPIAVAQQFLSRARDTRAVAGSCAVLKESHALPRRPSVWLCTPCVHIYSTQTHTPWKSLGYALYIYTSLHGVASFFYVFIVSFSSLAPSSISHRLFPRLVGVQTSADI